jgi:hypothetical protein
MQSHWLGPRGLPLGHTDQQGTHVLLAQTRLIRGLHAWHLACTDARLLCPSPVTVHALAKSHALTHVADLLHVAARPVTHLHTCSDAHTTWTHAVPIAHLRPSEAMQLWLGGASPSDLTVKATTSSSAELRWTASTNSSARYEVWRTFDPGMKNPPEKGWLVLGWTVKTQWESVGMEGGTRCACVLGHLSSLCAQQ